MFRKCKSESTVATGNRWRSNVVHGPDVHLDYTRFIVQRTPDVPVVDHTHSLALTFVRNTVGRAQ
jgi:hypothetical protein